MTMTPTEKDAMALAVLDAVKAVILRRLHRYNKKANDTIKAGKVPHPECIVQQERAAYLVDEYDTARAHLASRIAELEAELAAVRNVLTSIRDSTFRSALILRGMAQRGLDAARGGE